MAVLEANLYDFDHTIYRGDASVDFIKYCIAGNPRLWKYLPRLCVALVHYILGTRSREQAKQEAFSFLHDIVDIDATLASFWNKYAARIAPWYAALHADTDIVISASPGFLLQPIGRTLNVQAVIATKMDAATGKITGSNCRGEEKVRRLREYDAALTIDKCYSDSLSDLPILQLARQAYIVKGAALIPLADYQPSKLDGLRDPAFIRFLMVGAINSFLGIVFAYAITFFVSSPLLAYALGYMLSLVISYFLNAVITFKEFSFSAKQFIKFCVSYIPNFVVVFSVVHILVNIMHLYSLVAYIAAAIIAAPITFILLSKFTFTGKGTA